MLCRLRTPCCQFRVPVVLEELQRRQALPWSRCPTEHGVRRRSNAAAGVFGLRRGGGRGRVGCAASYARIGRRGACEERAVKRRPVVALPGACDEGAVKGGAAYASAGGLADAGLACELVSRRRRGPAPGTRTGWVGAAVVLASGGYGWDKDRNRNWRCTATGGIAGGGGSGPGHVDRFASKASGWSCASWPACLLLLRRPGGRGDRGVWGAGPLQARGFGGGAAPPCCPPPPDFIPYNVQL